MVKNPVDRRERRSLEDRADAQAGRGGVVLAQRRRLRRHRIRHRPRCAARTSANARDCLIAIAHPEVPRAA
ncbi:MAG: hypothetical protein MZU97_24305 [Bacillus subtilis]|nr:hypothetical protein [Bacillus subtilis]